MSLITITMHAHPYALKRFTPEQLESGMTPAHPSDLYTMGFSSSQHRFDCRVRIQNHKMLLMAVLDEGYTVPRTTKQRQIWFKSAIEEWSEQTDVHSRFREFLAEASVELWMDGYTLEGAYLFNHKPWPVPALSEYSRIHPYNMSCLVMLLNTTFHHEPKQDIMDMSTP